MKTRFPRVRVGDDSWLSSGGMIHDLGGVRTKRHTVLRRVSDSLHQIAALAYALWLTVGIAQGPRSYRTNDDVGMQAIASGDFTGSPDARWVFSGPLTSWPVSALYRVADLPWYGLFQYAVHVVSGAAIVWVLVRRRDRVGAVALVGALLMLLVLQYRMVILLSFTGAAFVAGFAGVALAFDSADRRFRESWVSTTVAVLLLIAATSIRADVLPAVLLVGGPLVLVAGRTQLRRLLAFGSVPVLALALNWLLVRMFTEAPYQEYLRYNELRGSLHGTPRLAADALSDATLAEAGWTSVDRGLFALFIFDDERLFGLEPLEAVARGSAGARASVTRDLVIDDVLLAYPGVALALAASIGVAMILRRWMIVAVQVAVVTGVTAAMTWLAVSARLPERVSLPLWLGAVVMVALSLGLIDRRGHAYAASWVHREAALRFATIVIVAVLGAVLVRDAWNGPFGPDATRAWSAATTLWYEDQLEFLAARPAGTSVVASGGALKTDGMDPLASSTIFADQGLVASGWWNFSPMFEVRKDRAPTAVELTSPRATEATLWFGSTAETAYYNEYLLRSYVGGSSEAGLISRGCAPLQPQTCLYGFVP